MLNQGVRNYVRFAIILAVTTIAHRILILDLDLFYNFSQTYYNPDDPFAQFLAWWSQYQTPILTGIARDCAFVLTAALIGIILPPKIAVIPAVILALFYAANIEHVHYNFSHIRLGTLYMALDPTFIEGSGMTTDFIVHVVVFLLLTFMACRLMRSPRANVVATPFVVVLLGAAVLLPQGVDPLEPGWMQQHPLGLPSRASGIAAQQDVFSEKALQIAPQSNAGPAGKAHNLLVVYLEGVSQYSLTTGDMPFLQGLAADNLSFTRYFGNQLQTSNGLYTTLTGHFPNFLSVNSPWDVLQPDDPAAQNALPAVLARNGYRTAFLQSAELSFMSKDKHLAQLGFQDVKGRGDWTSFHAENGWGIDDLGLFENTLSYIAGLDQTTPWMVSLLTSGTHAPYNVPPDFMPEEGSRMRAIKYADASAQKLVEGLRANGLLENTVVIFTADESREPGGMTGIENEILLNWLPLVVLHPNGARGTIDWPMTATTFRALALTLTGDWTAPDIAALNRPDTPMVFGNYYKSRVFWWDKTIGDFYACYTSDFLCARFEGVKDVTRLSGLSPSSVATEPQLQALLAAREIND